MILSRKQLNRMREIGGVLARHGWGHLISHAGLAGVLRYRPAKEAPQAAPARLRDALEELGPTFIKFGQLLSTRPDLIPAEYVNELSKLQDTAPTLPFSEIAQVIESSLGHTVAEVFARFNETPLAAASLGQVHEAQLKDGAKAIVKVQRPGIVQTIESDIEILRRLASFLEARYDVAQTYGLTEIVDEFAITIREELDYTREAHNTERLGQNLAHEKGALVPGICWDYTTTRVLTMDKIDGVKVTDSVGLTAMGIDPKEIASTLSSIFLKQIFVDGYFHADPHPGNIIVTSDRQVALIDAGQVRQLDSAGKAGLIRLLIAFEHKNTRQFADELRVIGITRGDLDFPQFVHDMEKILRQYYDLPASVVSIGQLLIRVMEASAKHKIRLPTSFAVLGKVLANIDGINRQLDPGWNFTAAARPYIARSVRDQLNTDELMSEAYRAIIDSKIFLFNLPEYLNQILRRAIDGSLRMEFKHKGLEELENRLDRSINRLAFALIVASIVIGSSVLTTAHGSRMANLALPFGIIGYVVAVVFGVWLLISIKRSGRL